MNLKIKKIYIFNILIFLFLFLFNIKVYADVTENFDGFAVAGAYTATT